MYGLDVEALIEVEGGAIMVMLKKSLIYYAQVGTGICAARWFGKGDVGGLCYGAMMYKI